MSSFFFFGFLFVISLCFGLLFFFFFLVDELVLFILQMNLDPWQAVPISNKYSGLTLNRRKILFECPLGRYWYLGDRVLAQVDHKYPPLLPQDPPDSMRKGGLLEGDDLKAALAGSDATGVAGDYGEFVRRRLQGRFAHLCGETVSCFNGALVMYSNGLVLQGTAEQGSDSEGSSPEGIAPQPSSHVEGPSASFQERYPHFPSWSCRVMNQDGSIGYMRLDRPEHAPNVPWTGQVAVCCLAFILCFSFLVQA